MAVFTLNFTEKIVENFINSVAANTEILYVFGGQGIAWADEDNPPNELLSEESSSFGLRNDILFGKRITSSDISIVVARNTWTPNVVYTMYDHRDADLRNKEYFVVNSFNNVYKCLFNNNDEPSTVEPNFLSSDPVELADGYIWKYMYTVSSANNTVFGTNDFIPIDANTVVEGAAINGAIDVIKITESGSNYITNHEGFIEQVVSTTLFKIDNSAANSNNFYRDSGFYVAQGTGTGTVRTVTSYVANTSGKYITLDNPATLDLTTQYIISPKVTIFGDGTGASAYSIVDPDSNTLKSIKMVTSGSNYTFAEATITSNTFFGGGATAIPIIPPLGGHGHKPQSELGGDKLSISIGINGSEVNRVPVNIEFRQFGIISNPHQYGVASPYTDQFFNQLVTFNNTLPGISPFTIGEILVSSTGALMKIIQSSVSSSSGIVLKGTFTNGVTVTGRESGITGTISNITSPDIDKYTGQILYYNNVTPLLRTQTASEALKIIIKF